jgi:hypothetical protein
MRRQAAFAGSPASITFGTMMIRSGNLTARCRTMAVTAAASLSMLLVVSGAAWPQTAPSQPSLGLQEPPAPQPAAPAPQVEPPQPDNPGLIHEMGKLFDKVLPPLKSPGETIDDLNARAKDAVKDTGDALSRLTRTGSMVSGRVSCPATADGTPDCKAGADKLCQSKGYKEGKSLNTDSAESCSARVLIPGRTRKPGDCRTDNYVTSALCQ